MRLKKNISYAIHGKVKSITEILIAIDHFGEES
jgi:hypothetical protein